MGLFNPNEYDTSTGLFPNDDDAEVVGAAVVRWDYNGKQATPTPAVRLDFMGGDLDSPVSQYFGLGKAEDWAPTTDGKGLQAIGKRQSIHQNTKAAMLFKSMYEAGVPIEFLDSLDKDVTALVGLKGHWVRAKIRHVGLKTETGEDKVSEAVLMTSLLALPGEAGTPQVGSSLNSKATEWIQGFLGNAGKKGVKKADLPALILTSYATDPDCNDILTMVVKDDSFLNAGPWEFDSGVIKGA
jgi:hypothetical protein